jgi:hypothetical protein
MDIDGHRPDINVVWGVLQLRGERLVGGEEGDIDFKDLLMWSLLAGGVTACFLTAVWADVVAVARRLAETPGEPQIVDHLVNPRELRRIYDECVLGIDR